MFKKQKQKKKLAKTATIVYRMQKLRRIATPRFIIETNHHVREPVDCRALYRHLLLLVLRSDATISASPPTEIKLARKKNCLSFVQSLMHRWRLKRSEGLQETGKNTRKERKHKAQLVGLSHLKKK